MPLRRGECEQLPLFRALPGDDMALRDAQDLMAYPFFSLGKSRRTVPIRFEAGAVALTVEGVPEHGIATIWDADVLIWAASQIIQARREGIAPSRLMAASPHEILRFVQRGTGRSDYLALRAALDRLQSDGRSDGIELILADWFFSGVMNDALVLTLDPGYFQLSGGIERWLYRLVRKHGGRQSTGWRFDMRHLYLKSGSLQRPSDFALQVRHLVRRQAVPGYRLAIERCGRTEWVAFRPDGRLGRDADLSTDSVEEAVDDMCAGSVDRPHGLARQGLGPPLNN